MEGRLRWRLDECVGRVTLINGMGPENPIILSSHVNHIKPEDWRS